jgi:DNA-binding NarL/FixJ family response regulator
MIRIGIADDHGIVRAGLRQLLSLVPEFEVVSEAANGNEVVEQIRQLDLDLLLMDLNMPGTHGVAHIERVKTMRPSLPVLILSMNNETQMAKRAIEAGANGYITKECEPAVLFAAIRKVASGGKFIDPDLAERMVFGTTVSSSNVPHSTFTVREREVFDLLITGKPVHKIAIRMNISNKTVSTHKVRLLDKLQLSTIADLMLYALQYKLLK